MTPHRPPSQAERTQSRPPRPQRCPSQARCRFVTVSELLQAGTPVTAAPRYEVREGDNLRYDKLFGKGTQ